MKYLNCPTCGTLCYYPSENFENNNLFSPINIPLEQLKREVRELNEELVRMGLLRENENPIQNYSSDELFSMYLQKLRLELIDEALKNEEEANKYKNLYSNLNFPEFPKVQWEE